MQTNIITYLHDHFFQNQNDDDNNKNSQQLRSQTDSDNHYLCMSTCNIYTRNTGRPKLDGRLYDSFISSEVFTADEHNNGKHISWGRNDCDASGLTGRSFAYRLKTSGKTAQCIPIPKASKQENYRCTITCNTYTNNTGYGEENDLIFLRSKDVSRTFPISNETQGLPLGINDVCGSKISYGEKTFPVSIHCYKTE